MCRADSVCQQCTCLVLRLVCCAAKAQWESAQTVMNKSLGQSHHRRSRALSQPHLIHLQGESLCERAASKTGQTVVG